MKHVTPVILCGGAGTRLWPLSRSDFPKQFLCLTGGESLFQLVARRVSHLADESVSVNPIVLVGGEDQRFLALQQLRECGIDWGLGLLEPIGRNTAPALTLAAISSLESGEDPILLVIPSDQIIGDELSFKEAVSSAITEASLGNIVVFGVPPDSPNSGYGYIKVENNNVISNNNIFDVSRYVEKPDSMTAQHYLNEGGYYWNAGMFVLKASVWISTLEILRPDILSATSAAWVNRTEDVEANFIHFLKK